MSLSARVDDAKFDVVLNSLKAEAIETIREFARFMPKRDT
jgi:hypothetical protein